MSLNTKQQLKCPGCGQLQDMIVWNSITVSDSPDLKTDLLSGKVNIFRCPSCSQVGLMPTPLLYHDEEKHLMISFTPCEDPLLGLQLFDNMRQASKDSGELEKYEDYNLRFVTNYNELLEKILIFDAGYSDKAVEVLKLMILMQDPEKADQRTCMFGKSTPEGLEFMVQDKKEGQIYTSTVPKDTYELISTQLRQSGVKFYSFDWEMVNAEYASKLLNGFHN